MFIKLHGTEESVDMYINVNSIESIVSKAGKTKMYTADPNTLYGVNETPEEVIELINKHNNTKLASDTGIITDIIELTVDLVEKKILEYLRR